MKVSKSWDGKALVDEKSKVAFQDHICTKQSTVRAPMMINMNQDSNYNLLLETCFMRMMSQYMRD